MQSQLQGKEESNGPTHKYEEEQVSLVNQSRRNNTYFHQTQSPSATGALNIFIMYFLLSILAISISLFNYRMYERYEAHHSMIEDALSEVNASLLERQNAIISAMDNFTSDYINRYEQIKNEFDVLRETIFQIKNETQNQMDQIQLISIQNTKDMHTINQASHNIKANSQQIKNYYQYKSQLAQITNKQYVKSDRQNFMKIQPIIWVFSEPYNNDANYLRKLYLNNIKYYAYLSDFTLKFITEHNYYYFLSPAATNQIINTFSQLQRRMYSASKHNLGDHFQTIKKIIILMALLAQNGGIILIDNVALTEPLTWIYSLQQLQKYGYVNGEILPQVISFYNVYYSDEKIKSDGKSKPIYKYPSIQRYFIAAIKKSEFIIKILQQMMSILTDPFSLENTIKQNEYKMGLINGKDPYYQFFYAAAHIVLQQKQRQLDKVENKHLLAINYFGLCSINKLKGPLKLHYYLKDEALRYKQSVLVGLKRSQLQQKMGEIRFVHLFQNYNQANSILVSVKKGKTKMMNNSFVHQLFFPIDSHPAIIYDAQNKSNSTLVWQNLNKKVWIYDNKQSLDLICNMLVKANSKINEAAGLQTYIINKNNLQQLIKPHVLRQLNQIFQKSIYNQNRKLRQYILILCLLSSQGGIYIDSNYLLLQDLSWVYHINSLNQSFIKNKIGSLPSILLFHNDHLYNTTHIDSASTSADINHVPIFQRSFIAADSSSELIDEWIQDIFKSLSMSQQQLQNKLLSCGINDLLFLRSIDSLPIDILRCLYLKGTNKYNKQSLEKSIYRVWSIDGDYGPYKLTKRTNYQAEDSDKNVFLVKYRQEQVQQTIGDILNLVKLQDENLGYLNEVYGLNKKTRSQIHQKSIFFKHVLNKL